MLLEIMPTWRKIMSSGWGFSSYMDGSTWKLISCCTSIAGQKCKMAANRPKPREYVIFVKIFNRLHKKTWRLRQTRELKRKGSGSRMVRYPPLYNSAYPPRHWFSRSKTGGRKPPPPRCLYMEYWSDWIKIKMTSSKSNRLLFHVRFKKCFVSKTPNVLGDYKTRCICLLHVLQYSRHPTGLWVTPITLIL